MDRISSDSNLWNSKEIQYATNKILKEIESLDNSADLEKIVSSIENIELTESESVNYLEAFSERITGALRNIDTDHAYIHEGIMFVSFVGPVTLGTGVTRKITFKTPVASGAYIHWRPSLISCSADKLTYTMYEGSSGNSGGTPLTPINKKRTSLAAAKSEVKDGVTVTSNGTRVDAAYLGGGTGQGQSRSGAETGKENELILKTDTLYTVELVNSSTGDNIVFLELLWYEEGSD